MNSFKDREKGFEAQFKRDQDLSFRVAARRNKLFGLWAAEKLGLAAGEASEAYARAVVDADFERPGDGDVIEKVQGDLAAKGIALDEAALRVELTRAAAEARRQLTEP
ncbi:MAG TPA: DUF1476 domain-containing protein [Stellaceae bacterium]|jgi:hypothetical protein|nr:DUF1476 domain-containing protein [Stellaceae bacterium]